LIDNWKNAVVVFGLGYVSVMGVVGALRLMGRAITEGFRAMREFQDTVASLAGTVASFMRVRPEEDLAQAFRRAKYYAEGLYETAERLDAQFIGTADELREVMRAFLAHGIAINLQNRRHLQGLLAVANAAKQLNMDIQRSGQLYQEVYALLSGQARMSDRLGKLVKAQVGDLKSAVEQARTQGRIFEWLSEELKGFAQLSHEIQDTWTGLRTTTETILKRIARIAFQPVYRDMVNALRRFNRFLEENWLQITVWVRRFWLWVKIIISGARNFFSVVWEGWKKIIHLVGPFLGWALEELYVFIGGVKELLSYVSQLSRQGISIWSSDFWKNLDIVFLAGARKARAEWRGATEDIRKAWEKLLKVTSVELVPPPAEEAEKQASKLSDLADEVRRYMQETEGLGRAYRTLFDLLATEQERALRRVKDQADAAREAATTLYLAGEQSYQEYERTLTRIAEWEARRRLEVMIWEHERYKSLLRDLTEAWSGAFERLFYNVFTGRLRSIRDVWAQFLQDLLRAWSRFLAQLVMGWIKARVMQWAGARFGGGGGGGVGGALGIVQSVLSIAGAAAGLGALGGGAQQPVMVQIGQTQFAPHTVPSWLLGMAAHRAEGGWVTRPTLTLLGEREPELVVPLSKMGRAINLTVVLGQPPEGWRPSPDEIVAVVADDVVRDGKLRKVFRHYL